MRNLRALVAAAAAIGLLLLTALPASADNVQNDIGVSGAGSFVAGESTTIGYRITSNSGDGEAGCNATSGSPTTVTVNVPPDVTVIPASLVFDACGVFQDVTFSSATPGSYPITVTTADSGPGTFNVQPAAFTLVVTAPTDNTPPVITKTITGVAGTNGWYTSNVDVTWSVTDPDSAVVIDDGCGSQSFTSETSAVTSSCTAHSTGGSATDAVELKIDKTGPSAVLTPGGTAGLDGWYTSAVNVTTSGSDPISGPAVCTAPQDLASETAGTTVTGTCTNQAGLSTSATPLTIKIDTTGPSASLTAAGTLGANGWYTSDVTVTATGSDAVSGGVTCTDAVELSVETTGTPVAGSCTNAAGLTTSATPLTVKIDKTKPTASLGITGGTLGSGGWYTSPVTVATTGSDTVSEPVQCTGTQTVSTDTNGTVVNGSCTNDAGLTQHADPITVKLDASAPTDVVLTPSGTLGQNGWYTSNVTVATTGQDATSGVTCTAEQTFDDESAEITVTGSCTNGAGLTTSATPLTIKLDKTAPTASMALTGTPGLGGWYVSSVTATASGTDSVSSPVTCTPVSQTQSTDTTGVTLSSQCTNDAGLSSPASVTVKVDRSAPIDLAVIGGPADGSEHYFGAVPAGPSGCTATDLTSGLASCSVSGYSTDVGTHTLTASAYDVAGNLATVTSTYTVKAWEKRGFFQPVDMGGVLNVVKNGSTVPLKFEAFAGAAELTDVAVVDSFSVKGITCPGSSTPTDDVELTTSGGTSLRYDSSGGQFIQNWQTPKKAGVCYRVSVVFDDGGTISADVKLR